MIHRYILEHRDIVAPILRNYDYRIVTMLEKKYYSMFMKEYEGLMSEEKCRFLCAHLTAGGIAVAARWLDSDNPLSPEEMSEIYSSITNPPHRSLHAGDPEKK